MVFNQNASKSRTRVGFQSKCPKEQDVRRCDAGKAVFVFSRFSPRGSASPLSEPINKAKLARNVYPKDCSGGIIGRGMNNAADSSPASDLRGKKPNKAIFRYHFQQNRVNQLIALGLRMAK